MCVSHVSSHHLVADSMSQFSSGSFVFVYCLDNNIQIRQNMNLIEIVIDWMRLAIRDYFSEKRANSISSSVLIAKLFVSRRGLPCLCKRFFSFGSLFYLCFAIVIFMLKLKAIRSNHMKSMFSINFILLNFSFLFLNIFLLVFFICSFRNLGLDIRTS